LSDDDFEYGEPPEGEAVPAASDEARMYEAHPKRPNSFFLRIGKSSHLSYQSEGATPVLALVMLIIILVAIVLTGIVAVFAGQDATWPTAAVTALGQAILAIIGAILGASKSK
jgi:hypothetical protein